MNDIQAVIEQAFEQRDGITPASVPGELREAVLQAIEGLDNGTLRIAEKRDGQWTVNEWLKKAVLLYFRVSDNAVVDGGETRFFDKVPLKYAAYSMDDFRRDGVRVVPQAMVRKGAFVDHDAVLMPSYVNIGARVGKGTMVDTWATVGSCAQIGRDVHLSGGVGIGGVLEPAGARPVIVEDGAFLGSRSIVVEGVHVGARAVLGANVVLTQSTAIVDVTGSEPVITRGRVEPESVVIPGTLPKRFPAGEFGVPCALVIGRRKPSTDLKTSLNATLREFAISV